MPISTRGFSAVVPDMLDHGRRVDESVSRRHLKTNEASMRLLLLLHVGVFVTIMALLAMGILIYPPVDAELGASDLDKMYAHTGASMEDGAR